MKAEKLRIKNNPWTTWGTSSAYRDRDLTELLISTPSSGCMSSTEASVIEEQTLFRGKSLGMTQIPSILKCPKWEWRTWHALMSLSSQCKVKTKQQRPQSPSTPHNTESSDISIPRTLFFSQTISSWVAAAGFDLKRKEDVNWHQVVLGRQGYAYCYLFWGPLTWLLVLKLLDKIAVLSLSELKQKYDV